MGAYENPAMIVDKSAEILTQGFQQASQAISKGILQMGAGLGERGKAEEKRRQELEDQQTKYIANRGAIVLDKVNDTKETLTEARSDDAVFDNQVIEFVNQYGSEYSEAVAMQTWPLSTKEEKEAASQTIKRFEEQLGGYITIGKNEGTGKAYFEEHMNDEDYVVYGETPQEQAINSAFIDFETGSSNLNATQEYDSQSQKKTITFTVEDTPENTELYGENNLSEAKDGKRQFKKTVKYDDDYSDFLMVKKAGLLSKAEEVVANNIMDGNNLKPSISSVTKDTYDDGNVATTTQKVIFSYTAAEAAIRPQIRSSVDALFRAGTNSKDNAKNMLALKTSLMQDFSFTSKEADEIMQREKSNVDDITNLIVEKVLSTQINPRAVEQTIDGNRFMVLEEQTGKVYKKPSSEDEFKSTMKTLFNQLETYKTNKAKNPELTSPFEDKQQVRSHKDGTVFEYVTAENGFRKVVQFKNTSGLYQVDTTATEDGYIYKDYAALMIGMGIGK